MIKKAKSTLAIILYLFHLLPDELLVVVGKCDLYLFIQKILNNAKATEAIYGGIGQMGEAAGAAGEAVLTGQLG